MTSVYRIYDGEGNILYVGQSVRAAGRLSEHAAKPWWLLVARVEIEHYDGHDEALARERELIRDLEPPHNICHRQADFVLVSTKVPTEIAARLRELAVARRISVATLTRGILREYVESAREKAA